MLSLCYGMGLRVSEVVSLKITDIDSNRMQVLIDLEERPVCKPAGIYTGGSA